MKRKKNILVLTSTFPRWKGDPVTARFVYDLAAGLTKYFNIYVLCPHTSGAKVHETIENMEVFRFRYFYPSRFEQVSKGEGMTANLRRGLFPKLQVLPFLISETITLVLLIGRRDIDLINTHWMIPQGFLGAVTRRLFKVPHLMTVHAAGIFALMRFPLGRPIGKFIVSRTDDIVAVSSYIKARIDDLVGYDTHATILPMGVNTQKFTANKDKTSLRKRHGIKSKYVLLFVGKLVPKKGLTYLTEAMQYVTRKNKDVELIVIGGGPLREALTEQATSIGVSQYVKFLGWVDNDKLPEYYGLSDVVIVPSIVDARGETEGMPVVIQEALASGRPVIASRVSGIPDVIVEGYNGWLIKERDPLELSNKIEEVLRSADLETVGANAVLTARKYDWSETAKKFKEVIDRAIK
ncbi:hypothetical protein AMJ83_11125 [candidate division WOR_3 bacterium SM23_42]|uniref:Glycosyltransferase subfamily 4-like N-terminal domain-containing protein n=1 Tax=candidate division WOR_3 bacterium SM23_42 TaxID=1703779 RepID=A0A0S8FNS1_UNCW3|nr:MAG: hypothetical protein AMJ83_11125 [candidate division WOR_3 bacterium SM23_42]